MLFSSEPALVARAEVGSPSQQPVTVVTIRNVPFRLEQPTTKAGFIQGLMFRESLPEDGGMLFSFQTGPFSNDLKQNAATTDKPFIPEFWMKNCRIPLDLLFIRDQKIIAITHAAKPCVSDPCPTYSAGASADMVIELPGGTAQKHRFAPGDSVRISE